MILFRVEIPSNYKISYELNKALLSAGHSGDKPGEVIFVLRPGGLPDLPEQDYSGWNGLLDLPEQDRSGWEGVLDLPGQD